MLGPLPISLVSSVQKALLYWRLSLLFTRTMAACEHPSGGGAGGKGSSGGGGIGGAGMAGGGGESYSQ